MTRFAHRSSKSTRQCNIYLRFCGASVRRCVKRITCGNSATAGRRPVCCYIAILLLLWPGDDLQTAGFPSSIVNVDYMWPLLLPKLCVTIRLWKLDLTCNPMRCRLREFACKYSAFSAVSALRLLFLVIGTEWLLATGKIGAFVDYAVETS